MRKTFPIKLICCTVLILLIFPNSFSSKIIQQKNETIFSDIIEKTTLDSSSSDIIITDVKGGSNLEITITNQGNIDYYDIEINTRYTGGIIFPPRSETHEIILLAKEGIFSTEKIKEKLFGIGRVQVSIELNAYGDKKVIGQVETLVIGPFVIVLDSILNEDNSYEGYTLYTPEIATDTYLINNAGEVVHKWNGRYIQGMASYLLENGNMLRADCSKPVHPYFLYGGFTGHVGMYNPEGLMIWDFTYSNSKYCLHHDLEPLPNGNILMIAAEHKNKTECIENGRNPDSLQNNRLCVDSIIEVDPSAAPGEEIVWEWHIWDHLVQDYDSTKKNYGDVSNSPELIDINFGPAKADWTHVNSVDYNEEFDQLLICSRELNEIWVIDHSTTTEEAAGHSGGNYGKGGDILYRWGNPQSYRAGNENDRQLFNPHDANWIEPGCPGEGNILIFNNQRELENEPNPSLRKYSTVDEIETPVDKRGNYYRIGGAFGPVSPIWSYQDSDPHYFYSYHLSGAQRLPNGNTLICEGAKGKFFEVTPEKGIVWKYVNPYGTPNHVANIYRYSKDYPGIKNLLN